MLWLCLRFAYVCRRHRAEELQLSQIWRNRPIPRPYVNAQFPDTLGQGFVIAKVTQFHAHNASVNGNLSLGVTYLFSLFFKDITSVVVDIVSYLIHSFVIVYKR
ncbi:hypothetical protein [Photorhabdus hindustanensis]|uniref:hypothetical protein n=1 Tax=Photorhabdus hindustanensis TaxID=2918802 RepID=UPI0015E4176C